MVKRYATTKDFPVEFFDMWQLAVSGRLLITFPSKRTAVNKKMQMHMFRKRLLDEAPVQAAPLFQVDLQLTELSSGECALSSYIPAWKQQVREAVKEGIPQGGALALVQKVEAGIEKEASHRLDDTLGSLGFTTTNPDK